MLHGKVTAAVAAAALITVGCGEDGIVTPPAPDPVETRSTFETDLDGWTPQATEVFVSPGDEIDWEIERTTETAAVGGASVFAHNRTDAARLWIQREYQLEPNTTYDYDIQFAFGTADWSDVNLWTILAGALPYDPDDAEGP